MTVNEATSLEARDGWKLFHVDSNNLDDAIHAVESGAADGYFLSAGKGFQSKDFPALCSVSNLKGIAAVNPGDIDWRQMTKRRDLRFLDLAYAALDIDLSDQTQLEALSILYNPKVRLPPAGPTLRRLIMRGYAPKAEDLSEISGFGNLEYFSSTQGKLRSLEGADALHKLKAACFHYERRLVSVSGLSGSALECLVLDHCSKIEDVEALSKCAKLKEFLCLKCPPLQSLRFLNKMMALELFTFVETNVLDGDMTPLFRLRYSGFDNKRHFSHTLQQVIERQRKS